MKEDMRNFPVLAIVSILSALAHAAPPDLAEFTNGKRSSYSTPRDEKAKGVIVSFEYPSTWLGEKGVRANTLYKITSKQGKGLEFCTLGIKELPIARDYVVSKEEAEGLFSSSDLPTFIPTGAKYISGKKTYIDGQPTGMVMFSQDIDRAGISMRLTTLNFNTYFDKKMIVFGCIVGSSTDETLPSQSKRMEEYRPLFQLMASTIVIHSKWK